MKSEPERAFKISSSTQTQTRRGIRQTCRKEAEAS